MRFLLFVLLQFSFAVLFAQDDVPPVRIFERYDPIQATLPVDSPLTDNTEQRTVQGDVKVIADPKIDRLMAQHTEHKHLRNGYRVQIFLGDRKTAEETKRSFMLKYPDIPAYISWLAPNFRLRVGDLPNRLEAENLLHQLRSEHPGSYIVPDRIETSR